jgi:guanylate kinase
MDPSSTQQALQPPDDAPAPECLVKESKAFALVVSGPSGVGKSTLCDALEAGDDGVRSCVTTTTRARREGEVDGEHYHFVSDKAFRRLIEADELVEYAEVHGFCYGATRQAVAEVLRGDTVMLLDIDVQGAETWKRFLGDRCVRVFVLPPSIESLRRRLEGRKTEGRSSFQRRMETARRELLKAPSYDYVIVNDTLEQAVAELQAIVQAERRRPRRMEDVLCKFGSKA